MTNNILKTRGLLAIRFVILIIIIIMIVLVLLSALGKTLQIDRYRRLKYCKLEHLILLDNKYHSLPRASSQRTVITLSTIPDRIQYLKPVLSSLLDQTVRVDEICLNLPHISRKGLRYKIPKWLSALTWVKIHRCELDQGPATKLLPTLKREQENRSMNTRIIVVDDDNIYNNKMIEKILQRFESETRRGKLKAVTNFGIVLDEKHRIPSLISLSRTKSIFAASRKVDIVQGFSGFLVTPAMFCDRVHDIGNPGKCNLYPKEAMTIDDVWFSAWLSINKIKIVSTGKIHQCLPIGNGSIMNGTPDLFRDENGCGFKNDQKVIDWFVKNLAAFQ